MGLPAVRSVRAQQYGGGSRRRCGSDPVKGTEKGLALTVDGNSRYCYLDPYVGGALAVAEAARNLACVGARPLGLTDCLNFGSPENPEVMWQFSQVIEGMRDACIALKIPVVSGNVSFYNETDGVPIYPTPTMGMVGCHGQSRLGLSRPWFKAAGDVVVLLGRTREELGGSEYLKIVHGLVQAARRHGSIFKLELAVQNCCVEPSRRAFSGRLMIYPTAGWL